MVSLRDLLLLFGLYVYCFFVFELDRYFSFWKQCSMGVNSRFGRERGNLQESKPSFRLKDRESKRQMEGNRSINLGKVSKNAGNRCGCRCVSYFGSEKMRRMRKIITRGSLLGG